MEKIIDILLDSFDFSYMLAVNVLTYFVIKTIDSMNGKKHVPTWVKRIIALICGLILGAIITITSGFSNTLLYSFILSLISWDLIFKPIIKRLKGADYKNKDDGFNI